MRKGRVLGVLAVVLGVGFGVQGGEYSTGDWWQLRREMAFERDSIARLEVEIDSLAGRLEQLLSDPEMVEKVAREQFGMIRDGEILYSVEWERE